MNYSTPIIMKNYIFCFITYMMTAVMASCSSGDDTILEDTNNSQQESVSRNIPVTKAAEQDFETAQQAVINMRVGWNLGNSLDSWGLWIGNNKAPGNYETAWGQPVTDEHLLKAFKAKGFNAIRVPVTWFQHLNNDTIIDAKWMNRVQQVVDYVINNNMYCILNVHHDTGADDTGCWLWADNTKFDSLNKKFVKIWQQIAERFRDYDQHLLFEGYNEMLEKANQWNYPANLSNLQAINNYAQSFVNTVRATGGNNAKRNLIVTTYSGSYGGSWGNSNRVVTDFVPPTDPIGTGHIAIEVHTYSPYDWVKTYNYKWTADCLKEVKWMFGNLDTYFISKGYPVIIGEYGTNGSLVIDGNSTTAQRKEAGRQAADITRLCKEYDCAAFYWLGLIDGKDRSEATFKWSMPETRDSILNAYYGFVPGGIPTGIKQVTM